MLIEYRNDDTATLHMKFCRYSPLVYDVSTVWKQILFLCECVRYALLWHDFDIKVKE